MAGHHPPQGQSQGQPGVSGAQGQVSGVMYALEAATAGASGAADEDCEEELMLNYKRVDDFDLDFFPDDLQPGHHPGHHPMPMSGVPGMALRPSAVCSGAFLGQQQQSPRSAGQPMQQGRGHDSKTPASLPPAQPPQSRFASVSTGYLPAFYSQMPVMYPLPRPPSPVGAVGAVGVVGPGRPASAGAGPPVVDWPQDRDAARRRLVRRTQIVEEFEDIPEHDYPPGQW